ncbi:hypothetical protein A6V39_01510 [Candidatus Mycoplasma haematobovis]|uniref:Uncharacterized protein n=1 Tax=Candidatus Mycoplasma haematobovis TaxID=432608 RepID=A0A1A9QE21_9MOLU|nr:hypothetical protein [Candidatus Mycoplasma haematobovis]OAL10723.1 hypothetical protein A6V39_01510 [Candidatus Mycoplasma haematobovis]
MNNSTIVKSLIGLALTGVTAAGTIFATWPSQKEEQVNIGKQNMVAKERQRSNGLRILEKLFAKYKNDATATQELARIIDGRSGTAVVFSIGDDGRFMDDEGMPVASLVQWCERQDDEQSLIAKYKQELNKEEICAFSKITS